MSATVAMRSPIHVGPFLRWLLTAIAAVVTAIALGIPALVFVHERRFDGKVLAQSDSPRPALSHESRALASRLERTRTDAPLVLSYHDIRPMAPGEEPDDVYTVTPAQFSAHMDALDAAGYRTISSTQLSHWLRGGRLPARSVYLTFDDGTAGLWRYADRVLAEHDFHGTAFVITGRVGTHRPYYLTWDELRRMHANGRWDLESHTRSGHGRIPVDAQGDEEPFLINRAWLPDKSRQETMAELTARVRDDVVGAKHDFAAHGLPVPRFFAYPFSAEARPTNDEKVPGEVARILQREYEAAFSNVEPDRLVSERDVRRRTLSRLEVFRFTTPEGLLARTRAASPLEPADAQLLGAPDDWVDAAGRRITAGADRARSGAAPRSPDADAIQVTADAVRLRPTSGGYVAAAYAPGQTEDWRDFEVSTTVRGLGAAASGTTATLTSLYASDTPAELSVSAGYARLQVADATVGEHRIPTAANHDLSLTVADGQVIATVDGREVGRGAVDPTASGGVALGASNGGALADAVAFADLSVLGPGSVLDPVDAGDPGPFRLAPEDRDGSTVSVDEPTRASKPASPTVDDTVRTVTPEVRVPSRPTVPRTTTPTVPTPTVPTPKVPAPPKPKLPAAPAPTPTVPSAPTTTVPTAPTTTPTTTPTTDGGHGSRHGDSSGGSTWTGTTDRNTG